MFRVKAQRELNLKILDHDGLFLSCPQLAVVTWCTLITALNC